jgi:hypothetical protein
MGWKNCVGTRQRTPAQTAREGTALRFDRADPPLPFIGPALKASSGKAVFPSEEAKRAGQVIAQPRWAIFVQASGAWTLPDGNGTREALTA